MPSSETTQYQRATPIPRSRLMDLFLSSYTSGRSRKQPKYYLVRSRSKPLDIAALGRPAKSKKHASAQTQTECPCHASHAEKPFPKIVQQCQACSSPKKDVSSTKAEQPQATPETTSQEKDAKLLEMKAANKSWKEIAATLGGSKEMWTNRFKELKSESDGDQKEQGKKSDDRGKEATGGKNEEKQSENKMNKQDVKGNKQGGNEQQDNKKKPEADLKKARLAAFETLMSGPLPDLSPNFVGQVDTDQQGFPGEPRLSLSQLLALMEDEGGQFTAQELRDLYLWLRQDEEERYLRIASKLFDEHGKRVQEHDLREKLRRMGLGQC